MKIIDEVYKRYVHMKLTKTRWRRTFSARMTVRSTADRATNPIIWKESTMVSIGRSCIVRSFQASCSSQARYMCMTRIAMTDDHLAAVIPIKGRQRCGVCERKFVQHYDGHCNRYWRFNITWLHGPRASGITNARDSQLYSCSHNVWHLSESAIHRGEHIHTIVISLHSP